MTALSWQPLALFVLGYPDKARALSDKTLAESKELAHANTAGFALAFASILHQVQGDRQAALETSAALISLATEQRMEFWITPAHAFHGWAVARTGETEAGLTQGDIHTHGFLPAARPKALTSISRAIRRWALHHHSDKSLQDLAKMYNPYIEGWKPSRERRDAFSLNRLLIRPASLPRLFLASSRSEFSVHTVAASTSR